MKPILIAFVAACLPSVFLAQTPAVGSGTLVVPVGGKVQTQFMFPAANSEPDPAKRPRYKKVRMLFDYPSTVLRYEKVSAVFAPGTAVDVWPAPGREGYSRIVITWASVEPAVLPQNLALLSFTALTVGTAKITPVVDANGALAAYEVVDEFGKTLPGPESVKLSYSDTVEVKASSPPPVLEIRAVAQ